MLRVSLTLLAGILVTACAVAGCSKKATTDAPPAIPMRSNRVTESSDPTRSRCYWMWWIAHNHLDRSVAKGRKIPYLEEAFLQTTANLRSMDGFASEYEKKAIEGFVNDYDKLHRMVSAGTMSRRVTRGLQRLEHRIKKMFLPKDQGK